MSGKGDRMRAELVESRIFGGRWKGLVQMSKGAAGTPEFEVICNGATLPGLSATPVDAGAIRLDLPLPSDVVNDGLQVFLVGFQGDGGALGRFVLFAGQPVDGDSVAEIALLRAELELLKAAFRRHCRETGA